MTDYSDLLVRARAIFTPGAPIDHKDFFSGRANEITRVVETLTAKGRHPVIYGLRGVGKTSLANIIRDEVEPLNVVKISCDGSDTFTSIWNRVLRNASVEFKVSAFGFSPEECMQHVSLSQFLGRSAEQAAPAEIADVLQRITSWTAIVLDEFDKVTEEGTKAKTADLIKNLSDNQRWVTLIIVGVANDISALVGQHPSIDRNLVQVELPVMDDEEITEIVAKGCRTLGVNVNEQILKEIANLSGGFPHYPHLLGYNCIKACVANHTDTLDVATFQFACDYAVQDAIEKYRDAYATATTTAKPSRYPKILCACSHARHDDRGVFRASDAVDAMRRVFNESVSVQSVVPALGEFTSPARGSVLEKVAVGNRSHYRLSDPMMRPFLRIKTTTLLQSY